MRSFRAQAGKRRRRDAKSLAIVTSWSLTGAARSPGAFARLARASLGDRSCYEKHVSKALKFWRYGLRRFARLMFTIWCYERLLGRHVQRPMEIISWWHLKDNGSSFETDWALALSFRSAATAALCLSLPFSLSSLP